MSQEVIVPHAPGGLVAGPWQAPGESYRLTDYVTRSPAMQRFLETARRIADTDSTLLILGATGVGKGLLARSIHNEGRRALGPFVSVNCGALTESLLESELFGHEKGSFTGASRTRRGYFELANRGTLFLDEITELPSHLQVKLLSAIEERRVRPVGSEATVRVDVRLIAASNRDIQVEVASGRLRSDLYYRLNVVSLRVPSLAERRDDISELAERYVEHFHEIRRGRARRIGPDALAALVAYDWPGNVRELVNVTERAVLLTHGTEITLEDLPDELRGARAEFSDWGAERTELDPRWLDAPWKEARRRILEVAERSYLEGQLERSGGRIAEVAVRAAIDPRSVFEKMRRLGLRKEDFRRAPRAASSRAESRDVPPVP